MEYALPKQRSIDSRMALQQKVDSLTDEQIRMNMEKVKRDASPPEEKKPIKHISADEAREVVKNMR